MRLIHWHDRERLGITFKQIESPFFAASDVRCSGLMKPDTHLGENARQNEVSDDQTTPYLFP